MEQLNINNLKISEVAEQIKNRGNLEQRTDFIIDGYYQTNGQMLKMIEILIPILGDVKVKEIFNENFAPYVKTIFYEK